jgi:hypothetical protein
MKKLYLLFLFIPLFITSCNKEVSSPTQGQLIATRLMSELKLQANQDKVIPVYVSNAGGTGFSFSGTKLRLSNDGILMVINGSSAYEFNLELLRTYSIDTNLVSFYF